MIQLRQLCYNGQDVENERIDYKSQSIHSFPNEMETTTNTNESQSFLFTKKKEKGNGDLRFAKSKNGNRNETEAVAASASASASASSSAVHPSAAAAIIVADLFAACALVSAVPVLHAFATSNSCVSSLSEIMWAGESS